MLQLLKTIHKPDKVYPTAGNPMLVICDDLQYWICKHSRDASKLINELLGSSFATIWDLNTPEISLINVKKGHIPSNVQGINFDKPCFGSKYIQSSQEINDTVLASFRDASFRRKIINKEDFLMIAFFDIWLSNEDRNHNNSNLLIDFTVQNEIYFTVFDHDAIFNSNALHRGVYQINDFESLINTELANILFSRGRNLVKVVDNLVKKFYLCTKECEDNLSEIISLVPVEWIVDKDTLEEQLRENLFTKEWLNSCEINFRTLIQENIK
ncbi:HipA family kinase [Tenacibaculum sp. FZY0031]|uniref:HipA family kinase n=1 Tax=Tenacibaculum sp. FZY0031 TaxID=3116648 RepID=UPI002EA56DD2|nr:HipA family kinase [Tenacibaculum sp. FZY0031]